MTQQNRKRRTKEELEKLKTLAYEWFMNTEKTQKEIADIVGITPAALSEWVTAGKWAELKALEKASRGGAIRNIIKRIYEASQAEDANAADRGAKWAAVLEKLEGKKNTVPNIINTFIEFANWLYPKDNEVVKLLNKYMNEYVTEKIGE